MKIKKGIGVSPGVAIAQAVVVDMEEFDIPHRQVAPEQAQAELARLRKAVAVSRKEILELRKNTAEKNPFVTRGMKRARHGSRVTGTHPEHSMHICYLFYKSDI